MLNDRGREGGIRQKYFVKLVRYMKNVYTLIVV